MDILLRNENTKKLIVVTSLCDGKVERASGACAFSQKAERQVCVNEAIEALSVEIIIYNDQKGEEEVHSLDYLGCASGYNSYSFKFDFENLFMPEKNGLLYYCFRINSENKQIYTSSINNVDYILTENYDEVSKFRLLVYEDGFHTPDFAKGAVMYHIFVDRFNKSSQNLPKRADAVINEDWYEGIPKYPSVPGESLDNNEFFGGDLYGIAQKLDYLTEFGVNVLYLSPIFKAYSNHKYDTGDYMQIDEMFGGRDGFELLLREAKKRGIRVILDGVFNHTGNDSRYFNAYGKYDSVGAYESAYSRYHNWYYFNDFTDNPDDYECWWGIEILPKLNNNNPETVEFFLGENGVVRTYLRDGAYGWRLDVADELPNDFLIKLREAVKAENPDALIIGEVWENAADKVAYGKRRKYFSGYQLDSVMNYPIKNAIIDYMRSGDCTLFYNTIMELYSSYPKECCGVLMNLLGTHDTERILTSLVATNEELLMSNQKKATFALDKERLERGVKLLKIASVLQFTIPGMPCIFYGDECGIQGFGDPFCRKPYPWGRENNELVSHYKSLGKLKRTNPSFKGTDIEFIKVNYGVCIYKRGSAYVCVNMASFPVSLPEECVGVGSKLLYGETVVDGEAGVCIPPESVVIIQICMD